MHACLCVDSPTGIGRAAHWVGPWRWSGSRHPSSALNRAWQVSKKDGDDDLVPAGVDVAVRRMVACPIACLSLCAYFYTIELHVCRCLLRVLTKPCRGRARTHLDQLAVAQPGRDQRRLAVARWVCDASILHLPVRCFRVSARVHSVACITLGSVGIRFVAAHCGRSMAGS